MQTNYMDTRSRLSQWVWCRRPKGRKAVVIAAIHRSKIDGVYDDKLVITKEYRVPIEGYEYGFPAGLIDRGETPEDAVRRELEEETGLIVDEIIHISPPVLSSAGITNEAIHMAYVIVSGEPNKDKLEASEDITTLLLDKQGVGAIMDSNDYSIGKSAYCVMRNFRYDGAI